MNNVSKFLFFFLVVQSILLDFSGCANPLPPSGGPRDTIPPKIKDYYPQNSMINFKDKNVSIKFDKYMDKNSVQLNTIIIPAVQSDFVWSGKDLKIKFLEPLEENTTYSISLGTEIQDWKGNKPDESFTLIFSTGNSIDSGKILGKLYAPAPNGSSIFLYKLPSESSEIDTFDITKHKPNYNIQIGSSGLFGVKALKDGKYRLIAVKDVFKNGNYDDGEDEFGAYTEDIIIKQDSAVNVKIKLGPVIDKLGPILYDVIPINNRLIEANFSEPLDSNFLFSDAFMISKINENQSEDLLEESVRSIIFSTDSRFKVLIFLNSDLDTTHKYKLTSKSDAKLAVRDTLGNIVRDTSNVGIFQPIAKNPIIIPELISAPIKDSSLNIFPNRSFEFVFNLPLIINEYQNSFKLINLSENFSEKFKLKFKNDNILVLEPEKKLVSDSWYEINFFTDSIMSIENVKMPDSTIYLRFKTSDIRNYSGISGSIKSLNKCRGIYSVIIRNLQNNISYQTNANNMLEWNFAELPPGDYEFEVFCDEDNNGRYSYGNAIEYKCAEKFYLLQDKITLKPRWKVEKYILDLQNE